MSIHVVASRKQSNIYHTYEEYRISINVTGSVKKGSPVETGDVVHNKDMHMRIFNTGNSSELSIF
jgi:hypothetical protein